MKLKNFSAAFVVVLSMVVVAPKTASAGPMIVFSVSEGTQPSNVGIITLTQGIDANHVNVLVHLLDTALPNPQYGFINSGGPHTPFAFTLNGVETGVTAAFVQPVSGFTMNLVGPNDATPFGTYGIGIDKDGGNGSGAAYFGDLQFVLFRPSGLSTTDFIANDLGYFFAADLTNGAGDPPFGSTGSQAWKTGTTPCIDGVGACQQNFVTPEPASMLLLGTGLLAVARARRKKTS